MSAPSPPTAAPAQAAALAAGVPGALQQHRPGAGIAFVCVAIALMCGQDAILKWLTGGYGTMQILLVRGTVVALVAFTVLELEGGLAGLRTRHPWAHAWRCALNVLTITLFIYALARLPLAEVMALVMAAPLFTMALSVPLLGERVGPRRWAACAVGFAGVLVMLRPSGESFNAGGVAAVTAAFTYSLMSIQTRRLTATERNGALLCYSAATMLVVSCTLAPFDWTAPALEDVGLMLLAGLFVSAGHICLLQGYRFSTPAVLAPFEYTALVWGAALGWLIWQEVPEPATVAGAAAVVASGLYILYRETRRLPV